MEQGKTSMTTAMKTDSKEKRTMKQKGSLCKFNKTGSPNYAIQATLE